MADVIVVGIVLVFVCAAIRYLWKEKKKGTGCIGCPSAGCCAGKGCTHLAEDGKRHTDSNS